MGFSSVCVTETESHWVVWPAWCAVVALWLVGLLGLLPEVSDLSIPLTLFLLALTTIIACWTPLREKLLEHPDIATFCVTASMFLIYGLARRFEWGVVLHIGVGEEYDLSPAAVLVLIGAVLSAPAWIRQFRSWANAMVTALLALTVLGFGSFWFLSQYYTVGATDILDPTPLLPFAMNLIEFLLLTLVCLAACAHIKTRKVLLTSLPLLFILLWGRHAFMPGGGEN